MKRNFFLSFFFSLSLFFYFIIQMWQQTNNNWENHNYILLQLFSKRCRLKTLGKNYYLKEEKQNFDKLWSHSNIPRIGSHDNG